MENNGKAYYWLNHRNIWRAHSTDGHKELPKKRNDLESKIVVKLGVVSLQGALQLFPRMTMGDL